LCKERPRGSTNRERSERELYADMCKVLRGVRKKRTKQIRFLVRSVDQYRINCGLTGWVLHAAMLAMAVLFQCFVAVKLGKFATKVSIVLTVSFALIWQYGYATWMSLYTELPEALRKNVAQTFETPHFVDD